MDETDWTQKQPTLKGWYWCAIDRAAWPGLPESLYEPQMFMVYGDIPNGLMVSDTVNGEDYPLPEMLGRLWAGPLKPPAPWEPEAATEDWPSEIEGTPA